MKICPVCSKEFNKPNIYCSRACYFSIPVSDETKAKMSKASLGKPKSEHMRKALSASTTGKPKPWQQGENNVNYGGAYSNMPGIKEKISKLAKERGQCWTDEHRREHSLRMLGDINAMRGNTHSDETKLKVSEAKKKQHIDGTVKRNLNSISKAEKAIVEFLKYKGIIFYQQYHIKGYPYWFDFYIPEINTILEYQGDYWHANPNKYPSGFMLAIMNKGLVKVDDIWVIDAAKKKAVLDSGFIFKHIWESDYKKEGNDLVMKVLYENA